MIRVVIADDHKVVRQGLAFLLSSEPGIEVAGEAEDGVAALQAVRALRPDVFATACSTAARILLESALNSRCQSLSSPPPGRLKGTMPMPSTPM